MSTIKKATIGGGCFWCVEAVFLEIKGVEKVISGYAGGKIDNPTYREVCSGLTGHAEVVQITYDEDQLTYEDLLRVFFTAHDPTTKDRQGADVGTQYRSVIYYHDVAQKTIADEVIKDMASYFDKPIVTELSALPKFFEAEDYHQNYYNNNSSQPYCAAVISPKLAKLRKEHAQRLKVA